MKLMDELQYNTRSLSMRPSFSSWVSRKVVAGDGER